MINLTIITPKKQESHVIEWIEANSSYGNLVIQKGHAPLIMTLVANKNMILLLKTGEKRTIYIERTGFLEAHRNTVTIILNQTSLASSF